jgi:hypothetical protein
VIGVYLMQQRKLEGAIPWLTKAKQAKRYEPRQFPLMKSRSDLPQAGALVGGAAGVRKRGANGAR